MLNSRFAHEQMIKFSHATRLDDEDVEEMFQDFEKYINEVVSKISEAALIIDFTLISDLSHQLKGVAGNLMVEQVAKIAQELEVASLNHEQTSCVNIINELIDTVRSLKSF